MPVQSEIATWFRVVIRWESALVFIATESMLVGGYKKIVDYICVVYICQTLALGLRNVWVECLMND